MKEEYAKYLIDRTKNDYNLIAGSFSSTREVVWRDTEFLLKQAGIKKGDRVLDLGCGNGRYCEVLMDTEYVGIDNSEKLIEIANQKYPFAKFITAPVFDIPFPDNYFDKVICIAVLHHIPSLKLRIKTLQEIKRVLKPGGILVLTAWNLWQRQTLWKALFNQGLLKLIGLSKLDFKDIFVPWKDGRGNIIAKRYFHLFTKKEIRTLAKKTGFSILSLGIKKIPNQKHSNFYLIAEANNRGILENKKNSTKKESFQREKSRKNKSGKFSCSVCR